MTHSQANANALAAEPEMSRRSAMLAALATTAGAALATTSGQALAADDAGMDHSKMDHSTMDHSAMMGPPKYQSAIDKALVCSGRGEVCVSHCLMMVSMGDTSMSACMASVSAMLPLCSSLAKLAALDAPRLKDLAKVCMDVCTDCEKECRKYEAKHAVCKACAEACVDLAKECKAIIGA